MDSLFNTKKQLVIHFSQRRVFVYLSLLSYLYGHPCIILVYSLFSVIPMSYLKRLFYFLHCFIFIITNDIHAKKNETLNPTSFHKGEGLAYQVYYSFIHAGTVTMDVDEHVHNVHGHNCYKVAVKGTSSNGLGVLGIKIENIWESYLDINLLCPHRFTSHIQENNYTRKEQIDFDYEKQQAKIEITESTHNMDHEVSYHPIPSKDQIKDLVSGYYSLRNIDTTKLKPGDKIHVSVLHDQHVYDDVEIIFLGKRMITTKLGQIMTLVFAPLIPTIDGSIFSGERPVEAYISDDANKIPIKLKANLVVGTVDIELSDYKGLKEELLFQKS
ncbi:hypothetical protein CCPUN_07700 [Cardinium endosymbiont of Culicoides punctatus]|nr:hypothetical protein CCPUN_07700 [Cardinium endosymbiont of Culicoides punctatus]